MPTPSSTSSLPSRPSLRRTATLFSGTREPGTSPRWSTMASSTGCSRPTPRGSRSSEVPLRLRPQGHLQPVEPGQRRPKLAPGARRKRLREGRQPGRHQRLRGGLRRGRWTVFEAIEEDVPANAIAGSLFARFASRQDDSFAMKVIAALRGEFGGHAIKEAATEQEK